MNNSVDMRADVAADRQPAQPNAGKQSSVTATWVVDDGEFAGLAERWDRLVDASSSSTPFQTHAWLSSWWRAYGRPGRLRVLVLCVGDEIVAAAPLYLKRVVPARVLGPIGEGISDFSDILIADDPGDSQEVVLRAMLKALGQAKGWAVIDLPEVPPGAAAQDLAERWPGSVSRMDASLCIEFPTQDMDSLVGKLAGGNRRKRRHALRHAERSGLTTRVVPSDEIGAALEHFHRLHEAQWEGRGINPEHLRPRFRMFLSEAIPAMVTRGQAVVTENLLGDEVMSVIIHVRDQFMVGGYLAGVSPALRNHVEVSTQQVRDSMVLGKELGVSRVSMLRGQEEVKLRWQSAALSVRNTRLVLGRSDRISAVVWTAAAAARSNVKTWLIEHAPWTRRIPDLVHQYRFRLVRGR